MKSSKEERIEKQIRKAIKEVQKKDIRIVPDEWGTEFDEDLKYFIPENNEVCALGALLVHENGKFDYVKYCKEHGTERSDYEPGTDGAAAFLLGVKTKWVEAFVWGFDESKKEKDVSPRSAFRMGKRIRKEFVQVDED